MTAIAWPLLLLLLPGPAGAEGPAAPAPPRAAPASPTPAAASSPAPAQEAPVLRMAYARDDALRMTVPVSIDGRGPYRFFIDTGAERTVIAREVAAELALPAGPPLRLATIAGVIETPSAEVEGLAMKRLSTGPLQAPLLPQSGMGAAGLIGLDGLDHTRVQFDFRKKELRLFPAKGRVPQITSGDVEEIVVVAQRRDGRLILHNAVIDGQRVDVIVDTGAATTIGNLALRNAQARRGGALQTLQIIGVSGDRLTAEVGVLRHLQIGSLHIRTLPIAFADAYPFRVLGLQDRPALMLGMDALGLFQGIEIDFARRRVTFVVPRSGNGWSIAGAAAGG